MVSLRICLIITLVAGATPVATAVDYTVPDGVTLLTEEQLLTRFIGNTLVYGDEYWVEYYEPPTGDQKKGRFKGWSTIFALYDGSWEVKGNLMCKQFDAPHMVQYNKCFTTVLDGDTITRYKPNGEVKPERGNIIIKLAPGNPKNL